MKTAVINQFNALPNELQKSVFGNGSEGLGNGYEWLWNGCLMVRKGEDEIEGEIEDEIEVEGEAKVVVEKFNSSSFPKVEKTTEERKKHINARIRDFSLSHVLQTIERADKSDFLKGKNPRQWTADFDWLMNPNNYIKVIEGKYDNRAKEPVKPMMP